jgi:hypothetical protein
MIQEYVNKLIENLPDDLKNRKNPLVIDLVLDGGVFNGSYLVGALYFLKEMEKRNYIKVDRISGCSIGSVVAFLYFIDGLDLMPKLYTVVQDDFKKCYNLKIMKTLKDMLKDNVPEDICEKVNNKLFICYNNIVKRIVRLDSVEIFEDFYIETLTNFCLSSSYISVDYVSHIDYVLVRFNFIL